MPARRPARLSATERKHHLLDAALPLLERDGLRLVSTRELARAAGVSEALLFKHFPTREALYEGVYQHCARRLPLESVDLTKLPVNAQTLVRLVHFSARALLVPQNAEYRATSRLIADSLLGDGVFARKMLRNARMRALEAKVVACVKQGIATGEIRREGPPPANRFWFARNIAAQAYLHRLPSPTPVNYDRDVRNIVHQATQFALRGLGLREDLVQRLAAARCLRAAERAGAWLGPAAGS